MSASSAPPVCIIESVGRQALWDYFPSRSNDCPGFIWVFDRAYGKSHSRGWICGSVQHLHEPCGIRYVEEEINRLNDLFYRYDLVAGELVRPEGVYFVECEYDPAVLNRLNQRRFTQQGGYVVIRRGRGSIKGRCRTTHIYASRPYRGTSWPREEDWTQLKPGEAIEKVASRSLRLPGVFSAKGVDPVTYSGDWRVPQDKKSDREDTRRFLVLGKARSDRVFNEARAVMNIFAMQRWAVSPVGDSNEVAYDQIPVQHRDWWVETSWSVVGSLNAGKAIGEVLAQWI